MKGIRHYENVHILLWIIKDSCWLMHWNWPATFMILPTVVVAIAIAAKSWIENEFWINFAICMWIIANAYWMCCEFFWQESMRYYAAIPFMLGLLSVCWYYGVFFYRRDISNKVS